MTYAEILKFDASEPRDEKGRWTTSKVSMQTGEYAAAQTIVTQHESADKRFTIRPTGRMDYRRDAGIRGPLNYKWRWKGYRLTDTHPNLPKWVSSTSRHSTVSEAKREAERRRKRYPA